MGTLRVRLQRADDRISSRLGRLRAKRPPWETQPDVLPWPDQPGAEARLALTADPEERALLEQWNRDGYIVFDDMVSQHDIDELVAALDRVWDTDRPIKGLNLDDVRIDPGSPPRLVSHAELLALGVDERSAARVASRWRIHGFEATEASAARIFTNARLRDRASLVLGCRARPTSSITFRYGSEQTLHQDMAVFHVWPRNHIVGAWVSCEDVQPGCGPLVFYPGSHREPMFGEFDRYPATNLHTADEARTERYQQWINQLAERYERKEFLARKGQVLLWHSMLFHGGGRVTDPALTRRSFVVHFSPRGAELSEIKWEGARW